MQPQGAVAPAIGTRPGEGCDLGGFLDRTGLTEYQTTFAQYGFHTLESLYSLSADDMGRMGVKVGHQKKLTMALQHYRNTGTIGLGASTADGAPAATDDPYAVKAHGAWPQAPVGSPADPSRPDLARPPAPTYAQGPPTPIGEAAAPQPGVMPNGQPTHTWVDQSSARAMLPHQAFEQPPPAVPGQNGAPGYAVPPGHQPYEASTPVHSVWVDRLLEPSTPQAAPAQAPYGQSGGFQWVESPTTHQPPSQMVPPYYQPPVQDPWGSDPARGLQPPPPQPQYPHYQPPPPPPATQWVDSPTHQPPQQQQQLFQWVDSPTHSPSHHAQQPPAPQPQQQAGVQWLDASSPTHARPPAQPPMQQPYPYQDRQPPAYGQAPSHLDPQYHARHPDPMAPHPGHPPPYPDSRYHHPPPYSHPGVDPATSAYYGQPPPRVDPYGRPDPYAYPPHQAPPPVQQPPHPYHPDPYYSRGPDPLRPTPHPGSYQQPPPAIGYQQPPPGTVPGARPPAGHPGQYPGQAMGRVANQPLGKNGQSHGPGQGGKGGSSAGKSAQPARQGGQQAPQSPDKGLEGYTRESLKALLQTSLESLYVDRIKPMANYVKGRLKENDSPEALVKSFPELYARYPETFKVIPGNQHDEEPSFFFVKEPEGFKGWVDIESSEDPYGPQMWAAFTEFLEDASHTFAGGRYGMARELQRRQLPFLAQYTLGELCHIVQLAIQQRRLIVYHRKLLKPIQTVLCQISPEGAPLPGPDGEEIREMDDLCVILLRMLIHHPQGLPLCRLKQMIKHKFNRKLSEMAFQCTKLIELFNTPPLNSTFVMDTQNDGKSIYVRMGDPERFSENIRRLHQMADFLGPGAPDGVNPGSPTGGQSLGDGTGQLHAAYGAQQDLSQSDSETMVVCMKVEALQLDNTSLVRRFERHLAAFGPVQSVVLREPVVEVAPGHFQQQKQVWAVMTNADAAHRAKTCRVQVVDGRQIEVRGPRDLPSELGANTPKAQPGALPHVTPVR